MICISIEVILSSHADRQTTIGCTAFDIFCIIDVVFVIFTTNCDYYYQIKATHYSYSFHTIAFELLAHSILVINNTCSLVVI